MSLEQQVTALVEASNNLTAVVNNKISEIDAKVNAATTAVPEKIRNEMFVYLYIDAIAGNDSNDGKGWAHAKKTLQNAIESAPSGAYLNIYLQEGQTHVLDGRDINCSNRVVMISGRNYIYNDPTTYVELTSLPYARSDGRSASYGFTVGLQGLVFLRGIKANTAKVDSSYDGKPFYSYTGSLFKTQTSKGTVILEHVELNIFHAPVMHQHTDGSLGVSDLLMRNVDIIKHDLSGMSVTTGRQYLMDTHGNQPLPFSLYGVEMVLQGATGWPELINQDMTNALTNLV